MSRSNGNHDVGMEAGLRLSMGFLHPRVHHHDVIAVRQLMLGAAVVMLLTAPFYGDSLLIELPFVLIGAGVLASLSAITRATEKTILTADAVAAGVGMCIYQTWALLGYDQAVSIAFILREILVVLFLFIFYFSVMASRSMIVNHKERKYFRDYVRDNPDSLPKKETYVHSQIFLKEEEEDPNYGKHESGRPFKEGD
ncbi:MAG: hypothetical protein NUV88_00855 [Candidatus Kaiserbacteria bacterium]|nr:hypothetical protein [Candidatus Kaiserbacteria bacterium]